MVREVSEIVCRGYSGSTAPIRSVVEADQILSEIGLISNVGARFDAPETISAQGRIETCIPGDDVAQPCARQQRQHIHRDPNGIGGHRRQLIDPGSTMNPSCGSLCPLDPSLVGPVRSRLAAGGKRIRTSGPSLKENSRSELAIWVSACGCTGCD
jgi:hypothetical protein